MLKLILLIISLCSVSFANDPVVSKVQYEGLFRMKQENLNRIIDFKPGNKITPVDLVLIIKKLYAIEAFVDINARILDDTLIIEVKENNIITSIKIEGDSPVPEKKIIEILSDQNVKKGGYLKEQEISKFADLLFKQTRMMGKPTKVTYKTEVKKGNNVDLTLNFEPTDNPLVIKNMNFDGNDNISGLRISESLSIGIGGIIDGKQNNIGNNSSVFSNLRKEIERIYQIAGFYTAKAKQIKLVKSPTSSDVELNIKVEEGSIYTVSKVLLTGRLLKYEDLIQSNITVKPGMRYNINEINKTKKRISDILDEKGYAYAQVEENINIIGDDEVEVIFFVDVRSRSFINRIDLKEFHLSNASTLRSYIMQNEASPFSKSAIEGSLSNLQSKSFIGNVDYTFKTVSDSLSARDAVIKVTDSSNVISFNAGGSGELDLSNPAFTAELTLGHENIFGKGLAGSLNLAYNTKGSGKMRLSLSDPMLFESGISGRVFLNLTTPEVTEDSKKAQTEQGASIRHVENDFGVSFGAPITRYLHANTSVSLKMSSFTNGFGENIEGLMLELLSINELKKNFLREFGSYYSFISVNLSLSYSKLTGRSGIPESGVSFQFAFNPHFKVNLANAEQSPSNFFKIDTALKLYKPLPYGFIGAINLSGIYVNTYNKEDSLLFLEYLSFGGQSEVHPMRGFKGGSLGPNLNSIRDSFGGNALFYGNITINAPIDTITDKFKLYGFIDSGILTKYNLPSDEYNAISDGAGFCASIGIGISVPVPLGFVFKVSLATPIIIDSGYAEEAIENLQHTISFKLY